MTAAQTPGAGSNGERVFIRLGPPPEEPGQFVTDGAPQSYPADVQARLEVDAKEIIGKYPNPRSALLPLLHLVQSEDGYVTPAGVEFCGEQLGLTGAEVAAVASFYTMYRRGPTGEYLVGVCTNTLCAVMGGDAIFDSLKEHLGIGNDETTDGRIGHPATHRVQRRVRLRTGGDGQLGVLRQPDRRVGAQARRRTALRATSCAHRAVAPLCKFKETERILAGFPDPRPDEGQGGAGAATLAGLRVAKEHNMTAPSPESSGEGQ